MNRVPSIIPGNPALPPTDILIKSIMIGHDETLSEILAEKGSNVYHVEPEATVAEAVALMNLKKIGALLVMSGDHLVGIFTERDALTRIIGAGRDPRRTLVNQVMSTNLAVVHPCTTVE